MPKMRHAVISPKGSTAINLMEALTVLKEGDQEEIKECSAVEQPPSDVEQDSFQVNPNYGSLFFKETVSDDDQ